MALSEALIGVVIGGVIASIAPIAHLFADHRRWKHETKLAHLREERRRLEQMYSNTLTKLGDAMANNSYPSDMMSDILILMPKDIGERFEAWMAEKDKDPAKGKHAYMDICVAMKRSLADLDKRIQELIDA